MICFSNTSPPSRNRCVVDWPREESILGLYIHDKPFMPFENGYPVHTQKLLTVKMNISKHSLSHILQEDFCLGIYSPCASHLLDTRIKKLRYEMCESCQKVHHAESCLTMEKFLTSKRISITKRPHVYQ